MWTVNQPLFGNGHCFMLYLFSVFFNATSRSGPKVILDLRCYILR